MSLFGKIEINAPVNTIIIIIFTTHDPSRHAGKEQTHTADIELAGDLIKLEAHFEKPPKVHNDDRRRREELSRFHADLLDAEERADVLQNARVDGSSLVLERVTKLPHGWRKFKVHKEILGVGGADAEVVGVERLPVEGEPGEGDSIVITIVYDSEAQYHAMVGGHKHEYVYDSTGYTFLTFLLVESSHGRSCR